MSANKFKYFQVTTTQVVRANNQSDAARIAGRKKGSTQLPGDLVSETQEIQRVSATEAKGQMSEQYA